MLSDRATRGFFSVPATIMLKPGSSPSPPAQCVPPVKLPVRSVSIVAPRARDRQLFTRWSPLLIARLRRGA
jgi:hypothetical protein